MKQKTRKNPVCRNCRHLVTAHDANGCGKRRSTPAGLVYPCGCLLNASDLKDPMNRIDPKPERP